MSANDEHYDEYMARCKCVPECAFPGSLELSHSLASLDQVDRVHKVRNDLLCLSAPPGVKNELFSYSKRAGKKSRTEESLKVVTTKYCLEGYVLFLHGFCAIVPLSEATIHRHSRAISESFSVSKYQTTGIKVRQGSSSVRTKIAVAWECPMWSSTSPKRFLYLRLNANRGAYIFFCGGQNKNRFVMFFTLFLVLSG